MDQITSNLFIGDFLDSSGIEKLKEKEISVVFNVASEVTDKLPEEIEYIWNPLIDDGTDTTERLEQAIKTLEVLLSDNKKVLVHCMGGISRSATLIATFIAYDKNISFEAAIRAVQRYHPQANPSIEMRSLAIQVLRKLRE